MAAPKQANNTRKIVSWIFAFILFFLALFGFILNWFLSGELVNLYLHSAVEAVGFLAGLFIAGLLLTRNDSESDSVYSLFLPLGLLSMSILDGFHSSEPFGNNFVWLHSAAIFFGGIYFAAVWLPYRQPIHRWQKIMICSLGAGVMFFLGASSGSLVVPPQMLSGNSFTFSAMIFNAAGGLFFMAAAVFFLSRFLTFGDYQELAFAFFAGLNGLAGLTFPFGQAWQAGWWFWHVLRLVGYLTVLGYTLTMFKRIEIENSARQEIYRSVIQTSIDGFWVANRYGNILDVNDAYCQMIGYSRDELVRMSIPDIEATENAEEVAAHIAYIMRHGSDRFETRHRRKDGRLVDVEISVHYPKVKGERFFIFARDITERKKAQQQLVMNDRLASIGTLASGIAHEVGNPLTSIMGYANTLPLMAELPDEIKDGLKVIEEESQRAAGILRNLLSFARSEPTGKKPVNVNESISRVLGLRMYHRKLHTIGTYLSLDPGLSGVMGNRSQLEQVFYNIIANAEYSMVESHRGGNLSVVTEQKGSVIRAVFTDDGSGISQENLKRIFTPFFTTKDIGKGTGLGLSICLSIITEHGGRMWAESEEGKGAVFTIELPVHTDSRKNDDG